MSNWQYANVTPIKQYRGANALPRELKLFSSNGDVYMSANVAEEERALRKETKAIGGFEVNNASPYIMRNLFADNDGAFEIEADVTADEADRIGISLFNDKEEHTLIYLDMKDKRLVMDRTESGLTDFGKLAERHKIEKEFDLHEHREVKGASRRAQSINYKNDFALATWAPLSLCQGKTYHLDIFVDKCSVEIFVDGGRIAMTNLVFPTQPYNNIKVYGEGGTAKVSNMNVYKLGL